MPKRAPVVRYIRITGYKSCAEFEKELPDWLRLGSAQPTLWADVASLSIENVSANIRSHVDRGRNPRDPVDPGPRAPDRYVARGIAQWHGSATVMLPDPNVPPWPNPTAAEQQTWKQSVEYLRQHEYAHAAIAETFGEGLANEPVSAEGNSATSAKAALSRVLQARSQSYSGGPNGLMAQEVAYDTRTDNGKNTFPPFQCPK